MTTTELRQRRSTGSSSSSFRELDAFPKINEIFQETSAAGGGYSIFVFGIIIALIITEFQYYKSSELEYTYEVDSEVFSTLRINVDITVAMDCDSIEGDVLDQAHEDTPMWGNLVETPVRYELNDAQRASWSMQQTLNSYFREQYHQVHKQLISSGYDHRQYMDLFSSGSTFQDKSLQLPRGQLDACRLNGSFLVNRVAGNFHITAGKTTASVMGHHLHLSLGGFGEQTPGVIQPLEFEEKVTDQSNQLFQYFIEIVPYSLQTRWHSADSYQYSVTEQNRTIDHSSGSHGSPGIFFRYDLSPLKVKVGESSKPLWQFLIRLCAIAGGVFATSGMIHGLGAFLLDLFCCRLKLGRYSVLRNSS